jgi:hypothetical protein
MGKYDLYQLNNDSGEFEYSHTYDSYRLAANARDTSLKINSRLNLKNFQIRSAGLDKVYAFEVRVQDDEKDREVVIETLETLEVAEIEMAYEISVGKLPADKYRIVAIEEV